MDDVVDGEVGIAAIAVSRWQVGVLSSVERDREVVDAVDVGDAECTSTVELISESGEVLSIGFVVSRVPVVLSSTLLFSVAVGWIQYDRMSRWPRFSRSCCSLTQ